MFTSSYLRCPECRIVIADHDGKLGAVNAVACCGAHGAPRRAWPSLQAIKLLQVAETQDTSKPDAHRIALLFFASALEVMLEDVLVELAGQHTTSEPMIEAVLDSHQGVDRRRTLFKRLNGGGLGDVLSDKTDQEFLRDWGTLAERRNKVAHGSYYYQDSNDDLLIQRMRASYLPAFAKIHNHVTRRTATTGTP